MRILSFWAFTVSILLTGIKAKHNYIPTQIQSRRREISHDSQREEVMIKAKHNYRAYESYLNKMNTKWTAEYKKQTRAKNTAVYQQNMPEYRGGVVGLAGPQIVESSEIDEKERQFKQADTKYEKLYKEHYHQTKRARGVQGQQQFFSLIKPVCTKKHKVAYIWLGDSTVPQPYQAILEECGQRVVLLGIADFQRYTKLWNSEQNKEEMKINSEKTLLITKVDMLKLLYLYYESGIYADFDTQIDQQCFEKVYSQEIIFTNVNQRGSRTVLVPEENFMFVRQKKNAQVKRMLQFEIQEKNRWAQCESRQCLIVSCQQHYRDNIYLKGYN